MSFPFGPLPTIREFLDVAISLGCEIIEVPGVVGPNGPVDSRCLLGPPPRRMPYPLPNKKDTEFLTPNEIGSIERTLQIKTGFPSI